jgi:hypothetical protein
VGDAAPTAIACSICCFGSGVARGDAVILTENGGNDSKITA